MTFSIRPETMSPFTNSPFPLQRTMKSFTLGVFWCYFYRPKKLATDVQMFWRYILRLTIPSFLNLPLLIGHILAIETTCPQLWQRKEISQSLNFYFELWTLRTYFSPILSTKADLPSSTTKKKVQVFRWLPWYKLLQKKEVDLPGGHDNQSHRA